MTDDKKQSGSRIIIDKLNFAEWQKFKELRLRAIREDPQAFITPYAKEIQTTNEKWQERLKNYQGENAIMFFAKDDKNLVGMIGTYWNDKNDSEITAHIFGVYVNKKYRGQKIGKALMKKVLQYIRERKNIHLVNLRVNVEDKAPFHLYESVGFVEIGRTKIKTSDGTIHNKILMEMRI